MRLLHRLYGRIPLWPLDPVPARGPVLVEIYTSLAARAAGLPPGRSKIRDGDAPDAALIAIGPRPAHLRGDRKSGGEGKSGAGSVDVGGTGKINKNNKQNKQQ